MFLSVRFPFILHVLLQIKHSRTTTTAWSCNQTEVSDSVTYRFRFLYSSKLKVDVLVCAPTHLGSSYTPCIYTTRTISCYNWLKLNWSFPVFLCAVMRTMCLWKGEQETHSLVTVAATDTGLFLRNEWRLALSSAFTFWAQPERPQDCCFASTNNKKKCKNHTHRFCSRRQWLIKNFPLFNCKMIMWLRKGWESCCADVILWVSEAGDQHDGQSGNLCVSVISVDPFRRKLDAT